MCLYFLTSYFFRTVQPDERGAIQLPPTTDEVTGVEERNISVVDDESSVVDLLRVAFEREAHTVEIAYDAHSALLKIKERSFDVIVSHLKMPGKSGLEFYLCCKEEKLDLA